MAPTLAHYDAVFALPLAPGAGACSGHPADGVRRCHRPHHRSGHLPGRAAQRRADLGRTQPRGAGSAAGAGPGQQALPGRRPLVPLHDRHRHRPVRRTAHGDAGRAVDPAGAQGAAGALTARHAHPRGCAGLAGSRTPRLGLPVLHPAQAQRPGLRRPPGPGARLLQPRRAAGGHRPVRAARRGRPVRAHHPGQLAPDLGLLGRLAARQQEHP